MKRWAISVLLATLAANPTVGFATPCSDALSSHHDIIYVCADELLPAAQRLATYRSTPTGGGYSSIVVPLSCIATGGQDPWVLRPAIRLFFHNLLSSAIPPPAHVVLIGAPAAGNDTTYVSNYSGIPTWHLSASGFSVSPSRFGAIALDDPYVYAPFATDSIPIIALSRIPATGQCGNNIDALNTYIDKLIEYESSGLAPFWKWNALHLVEDNDYDLNSGRESRLHADSLMTIYAGREYFFIRSTLYATDQPTGQRSIAAIQRWNVGLGFVLAYGTAGSGYDIGRRLLQTPYRFDVGQGHCAGPIGEQCILGVGCSYTSDTLRLNHFYPLVFNATCGGGLTEFYDADQGPDAFCAPQYRCASLAQYLLHTAGHGAVGVIGPARAIYETAAYRVTREWMSRAFDLSAPSEIRVGEVLRAAKEAAIRATPGYAAQISSFELLGDGPLRFASGGLPLTDARPFRDSTPGASLSIRAARSTPIGVSLEVEFVAPGIYDFIAFDPQGRRAGGQRSWLGGSLRRQSVQLTLEPPRSGVYFVRAAGEGGTATRKIVVVR